jgi:hypothetical protein
LEVDETAALASEIAEISKKVSMDTTTNDSSDDELEAEPMDVEDDAVYAKRYGDDMEVSGRDKGEPEKMATDDWNQLGALRLEEPGNLFTSITADTFLRYSL